MLEIRARAAFRQFDFEAFYIGELRLPPLSNGSG
jgi:hypothetical protein